MQFSKIVRYSKLFSIVLKPKIHIEFKIASVNKQEICLSNERRIGYTFLGHSSTNEEILATIHVYVDIPLSGKKAIKHRFSLYPWLISTFIIDNQYYIDFDLVH